MGQWGEGKRGMLYLMNRRKAREDEGALSGEGVQFKTEREGEAESRKERR